MTASEILHRHFTRPEDILDAKEKRGIVGVGSLFSRILPGIEAPQLPTSVCYRDIVEALEAVGRIGSRRH